MTALAVLLATKTVNRDGCSDALRLHHADLYQRRHIPSCLSMGLRSLRRGYCVLQCIAHVCPSGLRCISSFAFFLF